MKHTRDQLLYIKGERESGIKIGDKVRVTRKSYQDEKGWGALWFHQMDLLVGKIFTITGHSSLKENGFRIDKDGGNWVLPYFILEKVEDIKYVELERRKVKIGNEELYLPESIIARL